MLLKTSDWVNIISSILGGVIGGFFTYLGVKLTIKDSKKKYLIEKEKIRKEKILNVKSNRPELEIVKMKVVAFVDAEIDLVPFIKYNVSEYDYKAEFKKDILSKLRESMIIRVVNTGKTNIDEIAINIQDAKNTILLNDVDRRQEYIQKGYINFSKFINLPLKIGKEIYIKINFYEKCNTNVFYFIFKDSNGFHWKQEISLHFYNNNIVKTLTPTLISYHEYHNTLNNEDLVNYILYKSYFNYDKDSRFEFQGIKNFILEMKFKKYDELRSELTEKKIKFDEKFNFNDFDLYE